MNFKFGSGIVWKLLVQTLALCLVTIVSSINSESTDENNTWKVINLEKLNVHEDAVTISGFSAGASMATQLHVSHSRLFHGIAMFSQVFYRCGPHSIVEFGLRCSQTGSDVFPYDVNQAIVDAQIYEYQGLIDPTQNLRNQRVFIWVGSLDEYVLPSLAQKNVDFYSTFSSNPKDLISFNKTKAKHLFPTLDYGNACDEEADNNFYLGNCFYSGAFHALEYLLRDKLRVVFPDNAPSLSPLLAYNQSEFHPGSDIVNAAMGEIGFVYIPKGCQNNNKQCYLHINFHGCNEWQPHVAEKYIHNSGFLPIAEENNIILIFPLTTKVPENMDGCWDFYSYTDGLFATKRGQQVSVIRNLLRRVLGK